MEHDQPEAFEINLAAYPCRNTPLCWGWGWVWIYVGVTPPLRTSVTEKGARAKAQPLHLPCRPALPLVIMQQIRVYSTRSDLTTAGAWDAYVDEFFFVSSSAPYNIN